MATIYKYPVPVYDYVRVRMPVGARILTVQVQNGTPCIWALVNADPFALSEDRVFRLFGTGHNVPDGDALTYVGTYQMNSGALVFHLFEESP